MSTLALVILIVLAVFVLLAAGGAFAQRRRLARTRGAFEAELEQANADLARAHAEDRGWERSEMEAAARDAYARERPGAGAGATTLTLVKVVDRPGTDQDKAVFRVGDVERGELLTLGRRDGAWVLDSVE